MLSQMRAGDSGAVGEREGRDVRKSGCEDERTDGGEVWGAEPVGNGDSYLKGLNEKLVDGDYRALGAGREGPLPAVWPREWASSSASSGARSDGWKQTSREMSGKPLRVSWAGSRARS